VGSIPQSVPGAGILTVSRKRYFSTSMGSLSEIRPSSSASAASPQTIFAVPRKEYFRM
jgi:hypothetical protein